jgi:FlaA1/EpsC-like NDP-sugar epimerase
MPELLTHHLVSLPRAWKQGLLLVADVAVLSLSIWAAYSLRLGEFFMPNRQQFMLMAAAPILAFPIFLRFGLYRSVIRYLGEQALWAVIRAMALATLLWTVLAFMTEMTGIQGVPRTVPLFYWMLGVMGVGMVRFGARWLLVPLRKPRSGQQVLIYGAGAAGRQLAASLLQDREFFPAGFLDDAAALHGKDVAGLRVYNPKALPELIERFGICEVIVSLPPTALDRRKEVVRLLEQYPVRVRILPALSDIASGRYLVSMLREVDIADVLGRDAVAADPDLLSRNIAGRSVLVTGAGGSIGSELCRQIARLHPEKLVLLDQSEPALYQIDREVRGFAGSPVVACLGSVTDAALVQRILAEHGVQTIYHAAAHKHVPLVESNVLEGARNNVLGARVLAQAALQSGVETFVMISTDKAVRPTNVMGATKRWAELVLQQAAVAGRARGKHFCAVRFGNVLGSSGSVIPLFREQIAHGGPVTLTHPDVTRYFMSTQEAVELVIQAGSLAQGGEVFLLDMGEPVRILELARNMIRLAGHSVRDAQNPQGDIEIAVTGLRPGEKLYEELLVASSDARPTPHPKIMLAAESPPDQRFDACLSELGQALERADGEAVRSVLMRVACP